MHQACVVVAMGHDQKCRQRPLEMAHREGRLKSDSRMVKRPANVKYRSPKSVSSHGPHVQSGRKFDRRMNGSAKAFFQFPYDGSPADADAQRLKIAGDIQVCLRPGSALRQVADQLENWHPQRNVPRSLRSQ